MTQEMKNIERSFIGIREPLKTPTDEFQCSFCTRNRYNGDQSCPLPLGSLGDRDVEKGMNCIIKNCGCGSFHDNRAPQSSAQSRNQALDELWQFCIDNGIEVHGDLIGVPGDGGFILLKILKKIHELRFRQQER